MRLKDLDRLRRLSRDVVIPAFKQIGQNKTADKLSNCAEFIEYALCKDCYTNYFNGFSSCKQRLCPICSKKRSMLYFAKFVPVFKKILKEGYYINGLNFTIENDTNLDRSIKVINKAFRILQHDDKFYSKIFKKEFLGGVRCLETKLSEIEAWHTHLHCLVVKDHYSRDIDWLSKAWNHAVKLAGGLESKTTPGLYGMVSIFSLKDKHNLKSSYEKSVEVGCLETLKYITKFDFDLNVSLLPELVKSIKGVRCVNTWGILRNIDLNIESDLDKSFLEIKEHCCSVCGGTEFYEFISPRRFNNVAEFNDNDCIIRKERIKHGKCMLDPFLELGKFYDGVYYSQRHANLQGKEFTVTKIKDKYMLYVTEKEKYNIKRISLCKQ